MSVRWLDRVRRAFAVSPEALALDPRLAPYAIDEALVRRTARVQRLAELGPRNTRIVEHDALMGAEPRVLLVREAIESGVRLLFVTADNDDDLPAALGSLAHRLDTSGDDRPLYGVNVVDLMAFVLRNDAEAELELAGMSTRHMTREAVAALPPSLPINRISAFNRFVRNPTFVVYLVVFIYSSLRVLPVAFIEQFTGSLLVLWLIDVVTAVPYTWGILAMLFSARMKIRVIAAATTIATFVTPYVYFLMNGRDYPPYVPLVITALTLMTVFLEFGKLRQERRLRARYVRIDHARISVAR